MQETLISKQNSKNDPVKSESPCLHCFLTAQNNACTLLFWKKISNVLTVCFDGVAYRRTGLLASLTIMHKMLPCSSTLIFLIF